MDFVGFVLLPGFNSEEKPQNMDNPAIHSAICCPAMSAPHWQPSPSFWQHQSWHSSSSKVLPIFKCHAHILRGGKSLNCIVGSIQLYISICLSNRIKSNLYLNSSHLILEKPANSSHLPPSWRQTSPVANWRDLCRTTRRMEDWPVKLSCFTSNFWEFLRFSWDNWGLTLQKTHKVEV